MRLLRKSGGPPSRLATLVAVLALAALPRVAFADVITRTGTGSRTGTGAFNVTVGQFDPTQGTLNSITVTGNVFTGGSHGFENLEPNASNTISQTHNSSVNLNLPGGGAFIPSTLLDITTPPGPTITLPQFDGTLDFGGTSGRSFNGLSATGANQSTVLTGAALAAFIGTGNVNFAGNSNNTSSANGTGNQASTFTTNSGGNVSLAYNFTPFAPPPPPAIPEPTTLALLSVAFGAFGARRLFARRKTAA